MFFFRKKCQGITRGGIEEIPEEICGVIHGGRTSGGIPAGSSRPYSARNRKNIFVRTTFSMESLEQHLETFHQEFFKKCLEKFIEKLFRKSAGGNFNKI